MCITDLNFAAERNCIYSGLQCSTGYFCFKFWLKTVPWGVLISAWLALDDRLILPSHLKLASNIFS